MAEINSIKPGPDGIRDAIAAIAEPKPASGPVPIAPLPERDRGTGDTGAPTVLSALEKKAEAMAKRRYALHVALIMEQDSLPKERALFIAYIEGQAFVQRRLASNG